MSEAEVLKPPYDLHRLCQIFERATKEAEPGDEVAGNPLVWPTVRGVKAVADELTRTPPKEIVGNVGIYQEALELARGYLIVLPGRNGDEVRAAIDAALATQPVSLDKELVGYRNSLFEMAKVYRFGTPESRAIVTAIEHADALQVRCGSDEQG